MGELTGRVWRLRAGTTEIEGLDMRASAKWPRDGVVPTVDLTVYHPGPVLSGQVEALVHRIDVLAGYERDQGAISIGGGMPVAESIRIDRATVDMPLTVQLSAAKAVTDVVLSASWGSVLASEVIDYIRGELGLASEVDVGADVEYSRYTIGGPALVTLAALAADTGSSWAVADGALRMWPVGTVRRRTADLWSGSTGLMSVGPGGDGEIVATAFLRPALRPGDQVRIVDAGYNGDVRILELTHDIDTAGDTWATTIVAVPA